MVTQACQHLTSSLGRKYLIALTGLMLCGFLIGHLSGNFILFAGSDAFNIYGYKLFSLGPLLYVIEAVLALIFLLHLGLAIKLQIENKKARGNEKYLMKKMTGRGITFMSASMPYTGIILFIFLITHLLGLKFGTYYSTIVDGIEMRDLYRVTMEHFQSLGYTLWYCVAMIAAGLHTAHGFSSAFQSLGLNHPKYFSKLKIAGYLYALLIGGGFSFIALWAHLKGVRDEFYS